MSSWTSARPTTAIHKGINNSAYIRWGNGLYAIQRLYFTAAAPIGAQVVPALANHRILVLSMLMNVTVSGQMTFRSSSNFDLSYGATASGVNQWPRGIGPQQQFLCPSGARLDVTFAGGTCYLNVTYAYVPA